MMNNLVLELNTQEAQVLISILDEFVRFKGIQAAEAVQRFFNKIKAAEIEMKKND